MPYRLSSVEFYAGLLEFAGKCQHITSSDPQVKARLHTGDGGVYLWVSNPTRQDRPVHLVLSDAYDAFTSSTTRWGAEAEAEAEEEASGHTVTLTAPARDVTVLRSA